MRHRGTLPFALLLSCLAGRPAAADDAVMTAPSALLRSLLPTVVNITAYIGQTKGDATGRDVTASDAPKDQGPDDQGPNTLTGSGFIIDPGGDIATNDHVIDGAYRIVVMFHDGTTAPAHIVGGTRLADIAIIHVDTAAKLPAIRWGDSEKMHIGDPVFAVGNPLGIGISVSAGIVSALHRDIMDTPYDNFIQTDAAINHGNSGGPLFNLRGQVVGMNTAMISPTTGFSGLAFAIPSNSVHFIADQLTRYGWIKAGWLGVKVEQVTPRIADALGLDKAEGVPGGSPGGFIVAKVDSGSPAAKAGLRIGDVIMRYGDVVPVNQPAFLRDIVHTPIGTATTVTVWRAGQRLTVPVTIAEWPRKKWNALNAPVQTTSVVTQVAPNLGLRLTSLSDDARAQYGLAPDQGGVLVSGVMANTDAAHQGMVTGDVILRVQNVPVATDQDVRTELDKTRAQGRAFATVLILPTVQPIPGPRWIALRIAPDTSGRD
jgi:serine protease Do